MPEENECEHLCPNCDRIWSHSPNPCRVPVLRIRCSDCERSHEAKLVEDYHKMLDMPLGKAGAFYLCGKERAEEEFLNADAPAQVSTVLVYRPTTEAMGACAEFARRCESAASVADVNKILSDARQVEYAARNLWLFRGQLTLIADAELAHRMMLRSKRFSRTLAAKAKAMGVRVKEQQAAKGKATKKAKSLSEAALQALAAKLAASGVSLTEIRKAFGL